ncbi:radical SAM protein [bacterium]|nr:radical SAM protein [bacterium]
MLTTVLRILIARRIKPFVFERRKDVYLRYRSSNIGIYVHIPFCRSLCPFCPYYKVLYKEEIAKRFKDALINEIEIVSTRYRDKTVDSVYFGGGTPALLIDYLPEINAKLKTNFNISGDFAIELHPLDLTRENLKILEEIGFGMISIGIQSFSKRCLDALDRREGAQSVKKSLLLIKDFDFKTVDVDLIFGIPGQTLESLKEDFETAVEFGATQISTYPFIDFSFLNNREKPLGRREKRVMLRQLTQIANDIGFERTSIWTFAKRGSQRYSSITRDNFIGFGPSASSLGDNAFKINTFFLEEYINSLEKKDLPSCLVLEFDIISRASYWLFWNSYNMDINRESFYRLFGVELEKIFYWQLRFGEVLGLLKRYEKGYKLTERGAYYFHLVEQEYTHKYIDRIWRLQRTESYPERIII